MYIKLTRLDGSPIWINASFVVTVEPRRQGGSIVVPIGDGLDYDVRETAEQVLAMLGDAPAPTVVPVPAPKGLAPTPDDVSPESEPTDSPRQEAAPSKPEKRPRRRAKAANPADGSEKSAPHRTRAKAAIKPSADLTDEQVERLRKMAPGSMRKLVNTLATQFGMTDAEAAVAALQARGVFSVDREHVVWTGSAPVATVESAVVPAPADATESLSAEGQI